MKKYSALIVFFLFSILSYSQLTSHFAINLGYSNLKGNYAEAGLDWYLVQKNDNILSFSGTANYGYMSGQSIIFPEGQIAYQLKTKKFHPHSDNFHSSFYKVSLSGSPYYILPEIGINIIGVIELSGGYAFEINQNDYTGFQGVRLGINFHIPFQVFQK